MTLIFNKNGKRDTRLEDYEQAVVKAGLAKAEAEREVERARKELIDIHGLRDRVFSEIDEKRKELDAFDLRRVEIQKELAASVQRETQQISEWQKRADKTEAVVGEKKSELEKLTSYLVSLGAEIETKTKKIAELSEAVVTAREELARVQSELSPVKREFEELRASVKEAAHLKTRITEELTDASIEKQEIEERVAVLKADNRGGLDVLASLDAERVRLKEREEFLARKKADLLIYEKRLKKHCEKVGYNVDMVFK